MFRTAWLSVLVCATLGAAPSHRARVYFDRAHNELPIPPGMTALASHLNLEIVNAGVPITPASLKSTRLLYLRAPSGQFTDAERQAIVAFVNGGGSLLVVLDEEKRQHLEVTRVNDIIAPFGLKLTPDTPYLPNPGALAIRGAINRANREVPYDGGRAVEGGHAFAFQLDEQGKPGLPYGAWAISKTGVRVVVLSEGMASLFLGSPTGKRLTKWDGDDSVYFGKDASIFMEEVIAWLIGR